MCDIVVLPFVSRRYSPLVYCTLVHALFPLVFLTVSVRGMSPCRNHLDLHDDPFLLN
jgi:hypothetical protein